MNDVNGSAAASGVGHGENRAGEGGVGRQRRLGTRRDRAAEPVMRVYKKYLENSPFACGLRSGRLLPESLRRRCHAGGVDPTGAGTGIVSMLPPHRCALPPPRRPVLAAAAPMPMRCRLTAGGVVMEALPDPDGDIGARLRCALAATADGDAEACRMWRAVAESRVPPPSALSRRSGNVVTTGLIAGAVPAACRSPATLPPSRL